MSILSKSLLLLALERTLAPGFIAVPIALLILAFFLWITMPLKRKDASTQRGGYKKING